MTKARDLSQTPNASLGFKNRLINSDMRIDQRNAGASVTPTNATYTLDRWNTNLTVASKFSVQQNAGSVTPPAGFRNYLGVTSLSSYSVSSTDFFSVIQSIEGFNTADLGWGTASASPVTLSFWVRSSLTGTFGGSLNNDGFSRSYPFSYTISAANTWEQKFVTIAGDTTGTWLTNNGVGIHVYFNLGAGSTRSNTSGAWVGSLALAPTGATSVVGTNGATWQVTGVQLEKGSTATSFDYRPYGTELALCQRYFEKSYNADVVPGTNTSVGLRYSAGHQGSTTTAVVADSFAYKVTKRATPTLVIYDPIGNSGKCRRESYGVTSANNSAVVVGDEGMNNALVYSTGTASANGIAYHYTVSAEL